jgi:Ner family transcriptional regulator
MSQPAQGWHPEDIKAALRKRYGTLRLLSRTWGLHHSAITNTVGTPAHSVPTEKRIALALGVRPQELWPDRWDADGKALPRPGKSKGKSVSVVTGSQKKRAA